MKATTTTTKAQLTTDKALINIAKATTPESKDKAIEEGAKAIADVVKDIKAPTKPKEPQFTLMQAMGAVMKGSPDATKEVIMSKTGALYLKRSGTKSNDDQLIKYYRMSQQFLLGYAK